MAGDERYYSETEVEEILRQALQVSDKGSIDRARLLAMAAELGISEDAVVRAEAEVAARREADASVASFETGRAILRSRRTRQFTTTLASYLTASTLMLIAWKLMGEGYFWPFWILLPWGLGVIVILISVFLRVSDEEVEMWKYNQKFRREEIRHQEESIRLFLDENAAEYGDRKLIAIKLVRERFGFDLRDSKDAVDDYYRNRRRS